MKNIFSKKLLIFSLIALLAAPTAHAHFDDTTIGFATAATALGFMAVVLKIKLKTKNDDPYTFPKFEYSSDYAKNILNTLKNRTGKFFNNHASILLGSASLLTGIASVVNHFDFSSLVQEAATQA